MKVLSKLMIAMMAMVFIATSCDKEADDSEADEANSETTELPSNADDAFDLITKKWSFSDAGEIASIEFTADTVYIVGLSGTTKSTSNDSIVTGSFEISSAGTTITLSDYGTLTIQSVDGNTIVFALTLDDETDMGDLTGTAESVVSSSDITNLLCSAWYQQQEDTGELVWDEDINGEVVSMYYRWTFTAYGTMIEEGFESWGDTNGLTGYKKYATIHDWEWTDDSQSTITLYDMEVENEDGSNSYVDYVMDVAVSDSELTLSVDGASVTFYALD